MDKARLTVLYNELVSGNGDPFALLCQVKTWVEAELLGLSQEMARKYARLVIQRQRIAELISDPGPELIPARVALAEALSHINDSIRWLEGAFAAAGIHSIRSLEGAFAAAGIHISNDRDNKPALSSIPSCGTSNPDPRGTTNAARVVKDGAQQHDDQGARVEREEFLEGGAYALTIRWKVSMRNPRHGASLSMLSDGSVLFTQWDHLGPENPGHIMGNPGEAGGRP
jgi:hypothetical protein